MPVSTRSQMKTHPDERDQEDCNLSHHMRNPHYGLKEKMKALTLLYEQQKRASYTGVTIQENPRFSTQGTKDVRNRVVEDPKEESKKPHVMKENSMPNSIVTKTFVLPKPSIDNAKENAVVGGGEKIVGFSCPRKAASMSNSVARKLSMGGSIVPQSEPRGGLGVRNLQELETVSEKLGSRGSRILVFVRLRPMGKKERDAGSRCCVRIVNNRDIYLTEFANENDYLRLKRLRGRHFTFDASFPDTSTQHEVYSTS